jgi:hypothetical protein
LSLAHTPSETTAVPGSGLPGVQVIAKIRRLLIVAGIVALVYPSVMVASQTYCPGGIDGSGGFIDASGQPTDEAPVCIELTLAPSPLVYVGIAATVLLTLGRVMKANDEAGALQTLNRAVIGITALVGIGVVVAHVWFSLIPVEGFTAHSWSIVHPFPFGTIDVTTTPLIVE